MEFPKIFISYSRKDLDIVKGIKSVIEEAKGNECWLDVGEIEAVSNDISEEIIQGINNCFVFLFMLSSQSQESEYAKKELQFAEGKKKHIVLINIDDCLLTDYFSFHYKGWNIIKWNEVSQRQKCLRDITRLVQLKDNPIGKTTSENASMSDSLVFSVNGVDFKMMKVEGGSFYMGAQKIDPSKKNYDREAKSDEGPVHKVTVNSFYMGETLVTQALWKAVMDGETTCDRGWETLYGKGDNYPAYKVSWDAAQEFISKLNQQTGKNFRLATEEEWEYAARGGKKSKGYKYAGSNIIDDVAWYTKKTLNFGTKVVKTKLSNELGIYDMSGNMWEWCQNRYGSYHSSSDAEQTETSSNPRFVLRGGSWSDVARNCRVSKRDSCSPSYGGNHYGFRLVLPI